MPTTRLLAVTRIVNTGPGAGWTPNNAAAAIAAVNSDDPSVIGSSRMTTISAGAAGSIVRFGMDPMPAAANGGSILSVDTRTTGRRAGGSTAGRYNVLLRDEISTVEILSPTHVPGAPAIPPGFTTFNDNYPTDPNGNVWSIPIINQTSAGLLNPAPYGTGVAVLVIFWTVFWTGGGGQWVAFGISLLLPLLLPILGGMNLFHLNESEIAKVEQVINRVVPSEITTRPTLVIPNEREKLFWELFHRPVYGV